MKKEMTIFYEVHDNIYVNLTNKCSCSCTLCLRQNRDPLLKVTICTGMEPIITFCILRIQANGVAEI